MDACNESGLLETLALDQIYERCLTSYDTETLIKAKLSYFNLTGRMDESYDEFEGKLNNFNDWFIFQYALPDAHNKTPFESLLYDANVRELPLPPFVTNIAPLVLYSLFKLQQRKSDQIIIKDLLYDEKFTIKLNYQFPLMEGELFLGKVIYWNHTILPLKGVTNFPEVIERDLLKQLKPIKKGNNRSEQIAFCYKLETLKTKWISYGKVDPHKIFLFS